MGEEGIYIDTNIGRIPIEDYREIKAWEFGFDSYEELRSQGYSLGDAIDEKEVKYMNKLKVYDVDRFCRDEVEMTAFCYGQAAIIEGPRGVIFAEHEAVHQVENLITDSVVIPLTKVPEKGRIPIVHTHELPVQMSEITDKVPFKEMTMEEFFDRRDFNPRCQTNFRLLLESMKNIGLDPREYMKEQVQERHGLDALIQSAESEKVSGISDRIVEKDRGFERQ